MKYLKSSFGKFIQIVKAYLVKTTSWKENIHKMHEIFKTEYKIFIFVGFIPMNKKFRIQFVHAK